jgi:16S rRNA (cytidine1402-2'-O)-methyltransferase
VATPIGNLADITLRAIDTLGGVDLIAAEDTRHTARLLAHYHIPTPLVSCHEHNEQQRTAELIAKIRGGAAVALVCDAGTPSVSDPGYRLVCAAVAQGLAVFPIPGVSAALTALCAAGLPTNAFVFLGFAPKKKGPRTQLLESLAAEPRTLVFYESPHRIAALIAEILVLMGNRPAVVAREMTKLHEEFLRGTLSDLAATLAQRRQVKGECTLLVGGAPASAPISDVQLEAVLREALARGDGSLSGLSKFIARQHGVPRNRVYEMAMEIRKADRQKSGCR